ncbi:Tat proofreading chaperone DmsD [Lelliottia amnigena]|jgi:TorA maturation chaperone TorD|uniref:Tat proofreading chaperone DmsD n=1 Tax=Lelliottia amnigena TaxID=61646 RepID=UPI00192C55F9|nr:Tat proofreading chaperone DmsD [Lelliottia amnigena]MBL5964818.1 Tat proofreading chaperone DmsD [Lelliottia amnigena]MCE9964854.1 Tat proofreading chaperone DmsD [Lelliottia amnigena]QXB22748.1 Tat proofreading chaperone DmsD [Lelliottia amnigena]QXZ17986.1 Tat proofreading chaperone DmsD [Lelliottia amnigena]
MKEVSHRESFAIIARALGAVFYFPPDSEQAVPLVTALTTTDWYRDWPLAEESLLPVADKLRATTDETLPEAWQRLFIGPWALPAPPWGSVWLDRESVLFGESTLALRQWMRDNGITFDMPQNEPEDHFGTMLMLAAWLSEKGHEDACDQLLAWHLLPWSQRFLTVLRENARHPFYVGIAELAQMTLVDWQSRLPIPVIEKTLYR